MVIKKVNLDIVIGVTSQVPETDLPEVAFAGKSNVGKSSLINALMNRKSYARTSSQPGKTQTINYYNINDAMRLKFAKDRTVQVIYKGAELGTYPWSALYGYYTIEMDDEAPENVLITMEEDGSLSVQYSDEDDYLTFKCVKSAGEE